MHDRTKKTLEELERAQWFQKVGQKDTQVAIVLSSWEEAIKSCASDAWQDLLLEAANQYREKLAGISRERLRQWNAIVQEVSAAVTSLVDRKTAQVVRENQLPQVFTETVEWDILHLAMEAEYADVYEPGFFASQAYWYVHGHFPCGWKGVFPEGKLVIY
jgi:DNA-binding transcriptional regulator YdaS (Cro superfamily)